MTHSSTAKSPRLRVGVVTSTIAALGLLAFTGTASATVFMPPDGTALVSAVNSANANPGPDTILLVPGDSNANSVYLPPAPLNITGDLTIAKAGRTGSNVAPKIDGTIQSPPNVDRITIAAGANVDIRTVTMTSLGDGTAGQSSIRNSGTLRLENVALGGNAATSLTGTPLSTTTVDNSTLSDNSQNPAAQADSTMTFNNSTITRNQGGILGAGPVTLRNTAVLQNIVDCETPAASTTGSADSDGSCAVAHTSGTTPGPIQSNGGPTSTAAVPGGSDLIDSADQTICPTVDQRYFVRSGPCDIGAYEVGAAEDTTAPTCVVTAVRNGPPKQQDVTAQDGGSGLEPGNSPATASSGAYGAPDTGPPGAIGGIDNLRITNGTISYTPFTPYNWTPWTGTHPNRGGLVLTAEKTNQSQATQWSFTAKDIAGNVKHCQ